MIAPDRTGSGGPEISGAAKRRPWVYLVAAILVVGALGHHQPVSALDVLPFLIFLAEGAGVHALLLLVGVPMQFRAEWAEWNVMVPIAGYARPA